MNDLPENYTDYLYIEPIEDAGVLAKTLNCTAKVLAVGPDVKSTKVGDYVMFEKWDKPEVVRKDGVVVHFLREKDAITKVPPSWV